MNLTEDAKQKLILGNERYLSGRLHAERFGARMREELAEKGQKPGALIVCCSDSRVPPEIIFDQYPGDIFVVRTAGNVVDEIALGSIEYGVEHLSIPLVLVLGHENCGAVKATIEGEGGHGAVKAIIDKIKPSMEKHLGSADIYEDCTDENIRSTMEEIRKNAAVAALIREGRVEVAGAKYGIRSGKVCFF